MCVVTGARSEYGLLRPLIFALSKSKNFDLCVLVTGMHLSEGFGMTESEIESDGFEIHERVEMLLDSMSQIGVSKSIGVGMIGLSDALSRLNPDAMIILGDRFEAFAAAATAHVLRIPIIHLHGGELTEGSIDDGFRHAITKMSSLHFVSTEVYRDRVIQLGEHPERVFHVGAIGIESIRSLKLKSEKELCRELNLPTLGNSLIITYHPTTIANGNVEKECNELFHALEKFNNMTMIFTGSNADADGQRINKLMQQFVGKKYKQRRFFQSLGQLRYLSLLRFVKGVVGNSSSGIIEAPEFGVGTVNIGSRQDGRVKPRSVVDCACKRSDIEMAIRKIISPEFSTVLDALDHPYGKGKTTEAIMDVLKSTQFSKLNRKKFFDIKKH